MSAYRMIYCEGCKKPIRESTVKCSCGHEQKPQLEQQATDDAKSWASAYGQRCDMCKNFYPRGLPQCPKCRPSVVAYLARVMEFTGQQTLKTPGLGNIWKHGF